MSQKQFSLFRTRRFLPLLLTQFLGAFKDDELMGGNALVSAGTFPVQNVQSARKSDGRPLA